jgi:hypothetical protein
MVTTSPSVGAVRFAPLGSGQSRLAVSAVSPTESRGTDHGTRIDAIRHQTAHRARLDYGKINRPVSAAEASRSGSGVSQISRWRSAQAFVRDGVRDSGCRGKAANRSIISSGRGARAGSLILVLIAGQRKSSGLALMYVRTSEVALPHPVIHPDFRGFHCANGRGEFFPSA